MGRHARSCAIALLEVHVSDSLVSEELNSGIVLVQVTHSCRVEESATRSHSGDCTQGDCRRPPLARLLCRGPSLEVVFCRGNTAGIRKKS